jgi:UDP-MurNAc hydroxylase
MRVTMLGHAAVLCETEDVRILMDPWILGPANFRSWWHLPDVPPDLSGLPPLDYLYISHLHGDHFTSPRSRSCRGT